MALSARGVWDRAFGRGTLTATAAVMTPNLLRNPTFSLGWSSSPSPNGLAARPSPAGSWLIWDGAGASAQAQVELAPANAPGAPRVMHVRTPSVGGGIVQQFAPAGTGPALVLSQAWVLVVRGAVVLGTGDGQHTSEAARSTSHEWTLLRARCDAGHANQFVLLGALAESEFLVGQVSCVDLAKLAEERIPSPPGPPSVSASPSSPSERDGQQGAGTTEPSQQGDKAMEQGGNPSNAASGGAGSVASGTGAAGVPAAEEVLRAPLAPTVPTPVRPPILPPRPPVPPPPAPPPAAPPAVRFEENVYSFRPRTSLLAGTILGVGEPGPSGSQVGAGTLAAVEASLTAAHTAFTERHYQEAINLYKSAGVTIYSYLQPGVPTSSPGVFETLSKDKRLLGSLLSTAAEYFNILPFPESPDVGPRLQPDPQALGEGRVAQLGVHSSRLATPAAQAAFADLQTANKLEALGLSENAAFYSNRASTGDPELLKVLTVTPPLTVTAADTVGAVKAADLGVPAAELADPAATAAAVTPEAVASPEIAHIVAPIHLGTLPPAVLETRTLGVLTNRTVVQLSWSAGQALAPETLAKELYAPRVNLLSLREEVLGHPQTAADVALALGHDFYYVIPLAIAECLQALGEYEKAEQYYLEAAAYEYLNLNVEASYVWLALAGLYLDWGNSLFLAENPQEALPIYAKVIAPGVAVPTESPLYTTASLSIPAGFARQVIGSITDVAALPATINPSLTAAIVEVYQQLIKIEHGLDYWGASANNVPIWTFDYLQSVAINFTQLAIGAENDFIAYQERADRGNLEATNLTQSVTSSKAEANAAQLQVGAAEAEVQAYARGLALAQQRVAAANTAVAAYSSSSWETIQYQASSSQVQGGDEGNPAELDGLADQLLSGSEISGSQATIGAATGLAGSMVNREYEIGAMQRTAAEMKAAAAQAEAELTAAQARQRAAEAAVTVAKLRTEGAESVLAAFNAAYFTPDVWYALGQAMYRLYRRYFEMAQRVAQDMQKAYNFENDESLQLIRSDYGSDEVKGLLAADSLMADIQTFTYDLVTATRGKAQPITHTISLASRFPYLFETEFRKTGQMSFETQVDDFDSVYPGAYAGRIEAVEVLVEGIVPVSGVSGTLTNSGISSYRLPSTAWPPGGSPGVKYRVQPSETLVLSDFDIREDASILTPESHARRIFEGAGVASSWQIEVSPSINDIDFSALTDVRLVFYYRARFDPGLKERVLGNLASLPGVTHQARSLPLRWLYQDAFYSFQQTGNLSFELANTDFPLNQTQPRISKVALLVATDGSKSPGNIHVTLSVPGKTPASMATEASGIAASNGSSPFNTLLAGSALGAYEVTITGTENPQLMNAGKLDLSTIVNVVLIFEYEFTPRQ